MPTAEGNRDEVVRLAEFIRQNPDSLALDASVIATRANASEALVKSALRPTAPDRKAARPEQRRKPKRFSFSRMLDGLFARPTLFVAITFGLALLTGYLVPASPRPRGAGAALHANEAIELTAYALMFILHMTCYAWRGLSRYALYGATLIGAVATPLVVISAYLSSPPQAPPLMPFFLAALIATLSVLYAVIGVGCASVGAYLRFRHEEKTLRSRSRQDLLQRLFEIEEALRQPQGEALRRRYDAPWLDWVRRRIFVVAIGAGVAMSVGLAATTIVFPGPTAAQMERITVAEKTLTRPEANKIRSEIFETVSPAFFVLQFAFAGLSVILQLGIAFLGGKPVRSILVSLTYAAASTAGAFIPIGTLGYLWVRPQMGESLIAGFSLALVLGLFAGIGASVEERAFQSRRRSANDPAVLLAEFVEIQRSLNAGGQSQCVLVVDAAKSSRMKANSDPLTAEWSFRAYQEFIAEIVRNCHGRIHSTAGDGAMAAFDRADQAFLAARTIQTKVADFNSFVNRLKDPFRLRIGLHCGEVSGELDEVQFTAVLDIAAHVEAASQVGGIAATAPVVEQLKDHRFAALQDTVDGYPVFLAMNPTLDPEADA